MRTSCPFSGRRLATVTTRRIGRPGEEAAKREVSTPLGMSRTFRSGTPSLISCAAAAAEFATIGMRQAVGGALSGQLEPRLVTGQHFTTGLPTRAGTPASRAPGNPNVFA